MLPSMVKPSMHMMVMLLLQMVIMMNNITSVSHLLQHRVTPDLARRGRRGVLFGQDLLETKGMLRGQERTDHGNDCANSCT